MVDNSDAQLRLLAQDAEDLAVISAHMQDAVVRLGDMGYQPGRRRFALVGCRFDWLAAGQGPLERRFAGMHFDNVVRVTQSGLDQSRPDTMLNLLGVLFEETQAPSGRIVLTFSGGATVRLDVECVDAQLRDLGARWKTRHKPGHDVETPSAGKA
jgi:Protein of unknown function (DUF2948)